MFKYEYCYLTKCFFLNAKDGCCVKCIALLCCSLVFHNVNATCHQVKLNINYCSKITTWFKVLNLIRYCYC